MTVPASIIVPAHNRPQAISLTVEHLLKSADASGAEVLVVDDGSTPPLSLPERPRLRLLRTSGLERSGARNHGAEQAQGDVLIFLDDDMTVAPDFVERHVEAAKEFGPVLCVGKVSLPPDSLDSAFGRFRRTIEEPGQARLRGLVPDENFCTAGNMSLRRTVFYSLGGFDPAIVSGEDQDLAIRFSERGGSIVFLPEAVALHRDSTMDITSYCQRHEWGARAMAPFLRRYPHRHENEVRRALARTISQTHFSGETMRILGRLLLSNAPLLVMIGTATRILEYGGLRDRALFPFFRILLGLHLFRGFRAGLSQVREAPPLPRPLEPSVRA